MNFSFKKLFLFTILLIMSVSAFAQNTGEVSQSIEMADKFRADGKIYVVVATLASVMLGIIAYIWTLDRKVSKLEKQIDK